MSLTRFSPDALPTVRDFTARAVSPSFSEQKAAAMHTSLVLSLAPPAFRALYNDMAQAETVDDLSPASRMILRQAISEIEQKAWTSAQEQLHPRGEAGRFRSKPLEEAAHAVQDVGQAVQSAMDTAKTREPDITPILQDAVKTAGGKLENLDAKLKPKAAMSAKVNRMKQQMPGVDEAKEASQMSDALRYHAIMDADAHVSGIHAAVAGMAQRGYHPERMTNYWAGDSPYTGIHAVFQNPETGHRFEMEFHTPDSWARKHQLQLLGDQFRDAQDNGERKRIYDQMVQASSSVERPPSIMDVGTPHDPGIATPSGPPPTETEHATGEVKPGAPQTPSEPRPTVPTPSKPDHAREAAEAVKRGERPAGAPGTQIADPDSKDAIDVGDDVEKAAKLLAQGKAVNLNQPRQVSLLLDKVAQMVDEAKAKGEDAPNFDLCKVTVKNTNLFCVKSKGIPRIQMPQLKGFPVKGSKADAMPRDKRGEVDLTEAFIQHLKDQGVEVKQGKERAAYLKATQNELNGGKVSGIAGYLEGGGKIEGPPMLTTKDNYVIDGHHRWAAQVAQDARDNDLNNDPFMDVNRIDMDIIHVLYAANKFAEEYGIPSAGVNQGFAEPGGSKPKKKEADLDVAYLERATKDLVPECEDC